MRSVEEHLAHVLSLASRPRVVLSSGTAALGHVLARDVVARLAVPPFDNSAMDGYAVRADDVVGASEEAPVGLPVVGDLPAGHWSDRLVGPGQAMRIMTGAPVPPGADAVVPVEATDQPRGSAPRPSRVQVRTPSHQGQHIRRRGEDCAVGDAVAERGAVVTPALLSSLASTGWGEFEVFARPRVWVLSSGSELVAPGRVPGPGQIPDSNSLLLAGLVGQFGGEVVALDRVDDDPYTFAHLLAAGRDCDVVVTTGGVSVGAFEVVRTVTEPDVEFTTVAMQPGKPQGAGRVRVGDTTVPLLALPGNPVSVFVSAWLFVRPLLATMAGADPTLPTRRVNAAVGWTTPPGRRQYLPARVTTAGVEPVHRLGSGSHLVAALHRAEVLAVVDAETDRVSPGDALRVVDLGLRMW